MFKRTFFFLLSLSLLGVGYLYLNSFSSQEERSFFDGIKRAVEKRLGATIDVKKVRVLSPLQYRLSDVRIVSSGKRWRADHVDLKIRGKPLFLGSIVIQELFIDRLSLSFEGEERNDHDAENRATSWPQLSSMDFLPFNLSIEKIECSAFTPSLPPIDPLRHLLKENPWRLKGHFQSTKGVLSAKLHLEQSHGDETSLHIILSMQQVEGNRLFQLHFDCPSLPHLNCPLLGEITFHDEPEAQSTEGVIALRTNERKLKGSFLWNGERLDLQGCKLIEEKHPLLLPREISGSLHRDGSLFLRFLDPNHTPLYLTAEDWIDLSSFTLEGHLTPKQTFIFEGRWHQLLFSRCNERKLLGDIAFYGDIGWHDDQLLGTMEFFDEQSSLRAKSRFSLLPSLAPSLRVDDFSGGWEGLSFEGTLLYQPLSNLLSLAISLERKEKIDSLFFPELAAIEKLTLKIEELDQSFETFLPLLLQGRFPSKKAELQADLRDLRFGSYFIQQARFDITVGKEEEKKLFRCDLQGLETNLGTIERIKCSLSPSPLLTSFPWHCEISSSSLSATLFGEFEPVEPSPKITLHKLAGSFNSLFFSLRRPTSFFLSSNGIKSSPAEIIFQDGGLISFQPSYDRKYPEFSIEGRRLPIAPFFSLFFPSLSEARWRGLFDIKMGLDDKGISCTLRSDECSLLGGIGSFSLEACLNGSYQLPAKLSLSLKGPSTAYLHLTGSLPLLSSADSLFRLTPSQEIDLAVSFKSELSPLLSILDQRELAITGTIHGESRICGTMSSPQLLGSIKLQQGTFENLGSGIVVHNIEATMEAIGNRCVIDSLKATDGEIGIIEGRGYFEIDPDWTFPYELELHLNRCLFWRKEFLTARGGGILRIFGDSAGSSIQGQLLVDRADIDLPQDKGFSSSSPLSITYVEGSTPKKIPPKPENKSTLSMDISLEAQRNIFVRSRELRSEWGGHIRIHGPFATLGYTGLFRALRGDILINGKSFWIDNGSLQLQGNLKNQSHLNVSASCELGDTKVEAIFKGALERPSLTFRANPPMSEREILSLLLFSQPIAEPGLLELDQKKRADIDLMAQSKNAQNSSSLKPLSLFGIDRLDFDTYDDKGKDNHSVNVGKYLSRKLYVGFNRGITKKSHRLCVEAKMVHDVKLKAELNDDSRSKMLLMWKHDY